MITLTLNSVTGKTNHGVGISIVVNGETVLFEKE